MKSLSLRALGKIDTKLRRIAKEFSIDTTSFRDRLIAALQESDQSIETELDEVTEEIWKELAAPSIEVAVQELSELTQANPQLIQQKVRFLLEEHIKDTRKQALWLSVLDGAVQEIREYPKNLEFFGRDFAARPESSGRSGYPHGTGGGKRVIRGTNSYG